MVLADARKAEAQRITSARSHGRGSGGHAISALSSSGNSRSDAGMPEVNSEWRRILALMLGSSRGMKLLLAYARPGYIRVPHDTPAFAGEHASENAIMPSGVAGSRQGIIRLIVAAQPGQPAIR